MAKITNLDEVIPEDIEFTLRGQSYTIPGDVSVEDVLRMFRAVTDIAADMPEIPEGATDEELAKASEAATKDVMKRYERIQKEILALINLSREPDDQLTKSPFGTRSLPVVLQTTLQHLLPSVDPESAEGNGAQPTSKSSTSKKRSSSSSRSAPRPRR